MGWQGKSLIFMLQPSGPGTWSGHVAELPRTRKLHSRGIAQPILPRSAEPITRPGVLSAKKGWARSA